MHWQIVHDYTIARQAQLRAEAAESRLARIARAGEKTRRKARGHTGRWARPAITRRARTRASLG